MRCWTSQRLVWKSCLYILGVQTLANGGEGNMIASIFGISWMRKSRVRIAQQLPRILLDKKTSKIFQIWEDHYHAEPSPKQWWPVVQVYCDELTGDFRETAFNSFGDNAKLNFRLSGLVQVCCTRMSYQGLRFRKPTDVLEKPISPPTARHTGILQDELWR